MQQNSVKFPSLEWLEKHGVQPTRKNRSETNFSAIRLFLALATPAALALKPCDVNNQLQIQHGGKSVGDGSRRRFCELPVVGIEASSLPLRGLCCLFLRSNVPT